MGTKWTIIIVLGLMAGIRLLQPQFFLQWTTGTLDEDEPLDWRAFLLMWAVVLAASFLALGVAFDQLLWSERVLVLPGILLLRVLVADLLAQLFKPANKHMPWMSMRRLPQLALIYLSTAVLILAVHWIWPDAQSIILAILCTGHAIGLVIFSVKHQGFVHFATIGVRVYAVLYLCALELTPLYLAMR